LKLYKSEANHISVLSIVPQRITCEELGQRLSLAGFAVRTGYHCAPLAHESGKSGTTGTVRISVSATTEENEILQLCEFLNDV